MSIVSILLLALAAGAADAAAHRQVVQDNLKDVSGCYREALERDRQIHGKIVLRWSVDDQGKVLKISIKETTSAIQDLALRTCLMDRVKTWTFPPAPKGQTVQIVYPFVLEPSVRARPAPGAPTGP